METNRLRITFDTNIFIGRKPRLFPRNFYLSSIVLTELQAGAQDASDLKNLEASRFLSESLGQFVVPDRDDWWEAGKALQRLSQQSKRENFGSTPRFSPEERQRMFNDCLLAVSCRRAGVTIITDNLKDFERISAVCRVKWLSGNEFFTSPLP